MRTRYMLFYKAVGSLSDRMGITKHNERAYFR